MGLRGGDCYSWAQTFNPQQTCSTESIAGSGACSDATWFWIIAGIVGAVALFKKK